MSTSLAGIVSPVASSVHVCAGSDWTGPAGWNRPPRLSRGTGVGVGDGVAVGAAVARAAGDGPEVPAGEHAAARTVRTASRAARRGVISSQIILIAPDGRVRERWHGGAGAS